MGLWSTIKGWFNVGGVSVRIMGVENPFPRDDTVMKGKFELSTKTDKTILSTSVEFYVETTTGKGEEKETEKSVLGEQSTEDYAVNLDYPFELAAGETRELSFLIIDVDCEGTLGRMAKKGGVLGAVGKVGMLANKLTAEKDATIKYYVEVTADVKGTPFDPSDKVEIQVVPGRS